MLDDNLDQIANDAELLVERYDRDALTDLLAAQLTRISQTQGIVLGTSSEEHARKLVQDFLSEFGDELKRHKAFTTTLVQEIIRNGIIFLAVLNPVKSYRLHLNKSLEKSYRPC